MFYSAMGPEAPQYVWYCPIYKENITKMTKKSVPRSFFRTFFRRSDRGIVKKYNYR